LKAREQSPAHKFFDTARASKVEAQKAADATEEPVQVFEIEIGSSKAAIIAFLNDETTYKSRRLCFTADPKSTD